MPDESPIGDNRPSSDVIGEQSVGVAVSIGEATASLAQVDLAALFEQDADTIRELSASDPQLPPVPDEPLCIPQDLDEVRGALERVAAESRVVALRKARESYTRRHPAGCPRRILFTVELTPTMPEPPTRGKAQAGESHTGDTARLRPVKLRPPLMQVIFAEHRIEVSYRRDAAWVITAETPAGDATYERWRRESRFDPFEQTRMSRRVAAMLLARIRAAGKASAIRVHETPYYLLVQQWARPIAHSKSLVPVHA